MSLVYMHDQGLSRRNIRRNISLHAYTCRICESDPQYVNRLKSIKDPALRAAWLEGNWDVYIGQAFMLTDAHIIRPLPVPDNAWVYCTFDWGYGKPFSVGWWWVDNDGRGYRFSEWYGCGNTPDQGLRINAAVIVGKHSRPAEIEDPASL